MCKLYLLVVVNAILFAQISTIFAQDTKIEFRPQLNNGSEEKPTEVNNRLLIPISITVSKACRLPSGAAGVCTPLTACSSLRNQIMGGKDLDNTFMRYLHGLREICGRTQSFYCCASKPGPSQSLQGTASSPVVSIISSSMSNIQSMMSNFPSTMPNYPPSISKIPTSIPKIPNTISNVPNTIPKNPSPTPNKPTLVREPNSFPKGRLLTPEEGCGISKVASTKIVGGAPAKNSAYPWMALVGQSKGYNKVSFGCGGSLITSRHILTAAHCMDPDLAYVRLGEYDLKTTNDGKHEDYKIIRAVPHPRYDEKEHTSDIAILTLDRDVEFNDRIRPICLPLSEELQSKSFTGANPFVAGWGTLKEDGSPSDVLMELQVPVIDNESCKELYRRKLRTVTKNQFSNCVICAGHMAGGQDSCQGDSGGPLMLPIRAGGSFPMYQIGVVSYGIGCARSYTPGVYVRVSHYMDWIKENIK